MTYHLTETPPEWSGVIPIIENLAGLSGISLHACADILQCELKLIISNRFESHDLVAPFKSVDIRKRSAKTGIIVLEFHPGPHLEFYALQVKAHGSPLDIDIVSPPVADAQQRPLNLSWDRKYRWCYALNQRKVWFSFEETRGSEKLISVAIHFEEDLKK